MNVVLWINVDNAVYVYCGLAKLWICINKESFSIAGWSISG